MTIITSIFDFHPKERLKDVAEICKLDTITFILFEKQFQEKLELIQKNRKNVSLVEVDPKLYLSIFTKEYTSEDINQFLIAHWITMLFQQESIVTKLAYFIDKSFGLVSSDPADCRAGDMEYWIDRTQKEIVKLKDT